MSQSHEHKTWSAVDEYFSAALLAPDPILEAALRDSAKAGLPPVQVSPLQGRLLTLEISAVHAAVAVTNVARAGFSANVEVRVGQALHSLEELERDRAGPFDVIFIDADKPNNPAYLEASLRLARPGTLIIADNVVRAGAVAHAGSNNPSVVGIRRFCEIVGKHPRLSATALQTVGIKGHDGFLLAVVQPY